MVKNPLSKENQLFNILNFPNKYFFKYEFKKLDKN